MINNTNSRKASGGSTVRTGLHKLVPIMANPTNEDYLRITGEEIKFPLKYNALPRSADMPDGSKVEYFSQPITVLVKVLGIEGEDNRHELVWFNISTEPRVGRASGKMEFINNQGQTTWAINEASISSDYFRSGIKTRPLTWGEKELQTMLLKCCNMDTNSEESAWLDNLEEAGITPSILASGDVSGLNKLFQWFNEESYSYVGLLMAVEQEKDGNTYYNQRVNTKVETTFSCSPEDDAVPGYCFKSIKKTADKQEKAGYSIVPNNNYYTFEPMFFNKESCLNFKEAPVSEATKQVPHVSSLV